MTLDPQIEAAIRSALNKLDKLGADQYVDYWIDELFKVNGYPLERRWHGLTLAQIERDIEINS